MAAAPRPSPTQLPCDAILRATGYSNRWREPTIVIRNPYPLNTAFNCFALTVATTLHATSTTVACKLYIFSYICNVLRNML